MVKITTGLSYKYKYIHKISCRTTNEFYCLSHQTPFSLFLSLTRRWILKIWMSEQFMSWRRFFSATTMIKCFFRLLSLFWTFTWTRNYVTIYILHNNIITIYIGYCSVLWNLCRLLSLSLREFYCLIRSNFYC